MKSICSNFWMMKEQGAAVAMELQNTVKEALNALYHHPDDGVRLQADRWLQTFQRTLDAWQVSAKDFPSIFRDSVDFPTKFLSIHFLSLEFDSAILSLLLALLSFDEIGFFFSFICFQVLPVYKQELSCCQCGNLDF